MMPLVLTVIIWLLAVCMYCLFKSRWIRECTPTLVPFDVGVSKRGQHSSCFIDQITNR